VTYVRYGMERLRVVKNETKLTEDRAVKRVYAT